MARRKRKWKPTPKGMTLPQLFERFPTPEAARAYLESLIWPNGPACRRCGSARVYKITRRASTSRRSTRDGLYKCGACRRPFTVTVGTIFEASKIPLHKWLIAVYLISAAKKGYAANHLARTLGVTVKTAWFLLHRIRHAMKDPAFVAAPLGGPGKVIEADETYIGGKHRGGGRGFKGNKTMVVTLVERKGRARSVICKGDQISAHDAQAILTGAHAGSRLMTDESSAYGLAGQSFVSHHAVNHSEDEYVRREGRLLVTTNAVEGFFANLKRGITGVHHHVDRAYLGYYLGEFDFRYNTRGLADSARMATTIRQTVGRRLTLYAPKAAA